MQKKKLWKIILPLMAAITLLVGCGSLNEKNISELIKEKPVITWGVKVDTNLFGYYNIKDKEIQGFDIDMAEEITKRLTNGEGTAKFVEVSSKTRIPLLKNGNIDAIIATMTITPERKKIVDFSDVYFNAGQSLLVPNNSKIEGIDSINSSHTILVVKGSSSANNIRAIKPEANVVELENYSEAFIALQSGQGDALSTDNAILLGLIDQNNNYRLAGDIFTDEPYGIAVNKGQTEFKDDINRILAEMKADGTYDQIYNKWFDHVEKER